MSNIVLSPNASGTGSLTIAAPNTNTNQTLTLPDVTGTIATQYGTGVGKILQVVYAKTSTETATSSTSYVDTTLSANITPVSSSSRILVIVAPVLYVEINANAIEMGTRITRNSTTVDTFERSLQIRATKDSTILAVGGNHIICLVDSPASTSLLTYKLQIKSSDAAGSARINKDGQPTSTITLMEIAA